MHHTFIFRQITGSIKQTSVFVACVALSIVTLVSIGGFGESVNDALLRDARVLLAGDVIVQSGFPFEESLVAELEQLRSVPGIEVALTYQFITIVRTVEGDNTLLSELKAVESGYPFYGEVVTLSGDPLNERLSNGQILVAQNLLDRLGLQIGDSLKIGEEILTISDVVMSEPDQPVNFFSLGPRIFLSTDDLEDTGLIKPGSRVQYRALIQVFEENQIDAIAARLSAVADSRQVQVDTYRTNQSAVQLFFDNFLTFLSLIGIFTLFLAGIGIQSSLSSFIREREETIAILRTLGAKGRFIMIQFLGITAILGLSGTFIGLVLGVLLQVVFPFVFGPFLPPQVEFSLSLRAISEGMLLGFVVVTIFTFLPIYQIQGFKPRYIFRKEPSESRRGWVFYISQAMILIFLTAMTYRYLGNPERTAYFSVGIVVMILIITLLASVVLYFLRKSKISALDVRQALRGLFRPRNATSGIIITLAAALTVLFTIYLIERNLDASFVQAYPEDAPNLVILDIQPDQRDDIREVLGSETEFTALIFARIQRINGIEIIPHGEDRPEPERGSNPDGPPQLDDLFALTYREMLENDETLIAGNTMFTSGEFGLAQVSISERLLKTYPFALGDHIEFEIQGVPLAAQITSIRSTSNDGSGFGPPSFNFILREQDLLNAPQTIVTTATIPEEEISQFQNQLVASFPNLTVIDIRATISTLAKLVADITTIIRFFTAFSFVAGVLIIISSVLATRFARIQESVYYKVLGAKRMFVLRVFALENVFIGLVSAILALLLSQVASWLIITQVFELSYVNYWGSSILLMGFTVALVTSVGLLASISILRKKPITFLREQSIE